MTVYVDVLFVTNMFINYFILLITSIIAKTRHNRIRTLLASAIGGLYCVFAFTTSLTFLHNAILKILITLVISLVAFKFTSPTHYIRCTVLLIVTGLLFGGLLYGIYFLFKPSAMYLNNSVYFHISPLLLIICITASYLFLIVFSYFFKPHAVSESSNYTVTISRHGKSVSSEGFIDTGNSLVDIFTDTPVILCSYNTIENLLNVEEKAFFRGDFKHSNVGNLTKGVRVIPLTTVSGSKLLPAFKPDFVFLEKSNSRQHIEKTLVAVFDDSNCNNEQKVILNPDIMIRK